MPGDLLEAIKQQATALTAQEKFQLANYLLEQAKRDQPTPGESRVPDDEMRQRRLAWIKAHREEYAGQYVALDGDVLVGAGATIREAHEQAKQKGVPNPFLVRITSERETLFAGW